MSQKRAVVVLLFCHIGIIAISGCIGFQTNPVGIEPVARHMERIDYEDLGESEGESSSFKLFWFFPVTTPFHFNQAVDDAISKQGGDNLINVRSWIEHQIWIMGTIEVLRVKGTVIRYK